jgi:hypothetical protein
MISPTFRLTDQRRVALRMLAECPGSALGLRPLEIVEAIAPRTYGWSPQGATLWLGQYFAPLRKAKLVEQRRSNLASGWKLYWAITESGRDALDRD